ncbi:hypothetical protein GW915_07860 [bacterium]|nr:hypothetical protein [bacterium]
MKLYLTGPTLLLFFSLGSCQGLKIKQEPPASSFVVNVSREKSPVGGAYKLEEWVFSSRFKDCGFRWHASVPKKAPTTVEIFTYSLPIDRSSSCEASFEERLDVFEPILAKIIEKFPKHKLTQIVLGHDTFKDLSFDIARASLRSSSWKAFQKELKTNRYANGNTAFVGSFNEANIAANLAELFERKKIGLSLRRVEKVFTSQVRNSKFAKELRAAFPAKNIEREQVALNAGMYVFTLE